jgi:hypothetical protein
VLIGGRETSISEEDEEEKSKFGDGCQLHASFDIYGSQSTLALVCIFFAGVEIQKKSMLHFFSNGRNGSFRSTCIENEH